MRRKKPERRFGAIYQKRTGLVLRSGVSRLDICLIPTRLGSTVLATTDPSQTACAEATQYIEALAGFELN